MTENVLEGKIPPSIGNCQNLQYLNLWKNNLGGSIPLEVFSLFSLTNLLDLSQNSLSGKLLDEVGRLKNIGKMSMAENNLSGEIPETIGECMTFHGIIPSSLASLKDLRVLDMSRYLLIGSIPKYLQNFSFLEYFNVYFNMLEGEVPLEGVFRNASELGVVGNNKLCGGVSQLHLAPCPFKGKKPAKKLIGSGSFGSVYKWTIELEGEKNVVAIKVVNLQQKGAQKSFIAEFKAQKSSKGLF